MGYSSPHCHLLVTNQNSVEESPVVSLSAFNITHRSHSGPEHDTEVDRPNMTLGPPRLGCNLMYCTAVSYA